MSRRADIPRGHWSLLYRLSIHMIPVPEIASRQNWTPRVVTRWQLPDQQHAQKDESNQDEGSKITVHWTALLSAGVTELFCTASYVFIATGAVVAQPSCHTLDVVSDPAANSVDLEVMKRVLTYDCFLATPDLLNIALVFGIVTTVMVYAASSFSGGHLNPAVTFAMFITGRITIARAVVYILCQIAGAIVGSALVLLIDPSGHGAALGAANRVNIWANVGTALGVEILLTAIYMFVVFAAADKPRGNTSSHLTVLNPLATGLTVFVCHMFAIPIDGCSLSPARSFGTAVVANVWSNHWIFWVGPLVGGSVSALLYEFLAYRSAVYSIPYEGHSRKMREKNKQKHGRDMSHNSRGARSPAGEHNFVV